VRVPNQAFIMHPASDLDLFFRRGPAGDIASGLNDLRYRVLVDGIPTNADGAVGAAANCAPYWLTVTVV